MKTQRKSEFGPLLIVCLLALIPLAVVIRIRAPKPALRPGQVQPNLTFQGGTTGSHSVSLNYPRPYNFGVLEAPARLSPDGQVAAVLHLSSREPGPTPRHSHRVGIWTFTGFPTVKFFLRRIKLVLRAVCNGLGTPNSG